MDKHAHLGELFTNVLVRKFHIDQLLLRDEKQRLSRPLAEPIERATVNKRRELTAADTEGVTDRRHAQANVELFAHSLDEGLLDNIVATLNLDLVG